MVFYYEAALALKTTSELTGIRTIVDVPIGVSVEILVSIAYGCSFNSAFEYYDLKSSNTHIFQRT